MMTERPEENRLELDSTQTDNALQQWPPLKEVKIALADNGSLEVSSSVINHLRCLDNFIKNLTLIPWNFEENKNANLTTLTDFVRTKCHRNLHRICIVGDMELAPFLQNIKRKLRYVETFELRNRTIPEDEAQFLRYCPKLKTLILNVEIDTNNVNTILQQRYQQQHLTHFYYQYGNGINLNAEQLQVFFQSNDKVESVVWKFFMFDKFARQHAIKCLQTLGFAQHLKHFHLGFAHQLSKYTKQEFDDICTQLSLLCQRDTFKVLEIELNDHQLFNNDDDRLTVLERMKCFADWKKLTKMHLCHFSLIPTIPTIRELVHLNSMVLNYCKLVYPQKKKRNATKKNDTQRTCDPKLPSEGMMNEIDSSIYLIDDNETMEVPQIEEVKIKNGIAQRLGEICMPLVRHWKHLHTIIAPINYHGIDLDVGELNRAREKLKDACELTIYTNHRSIPTNLQHGLVKIRCELNR